MPEPVIRLSLRYYCRFPDDGREMREADCRYAEAVWDLRLGHIALVCVDVWDRDIHADMREIDDRVTRRRIVPVVEACRRHGLQVVHAPSPPVARRSPNWLNLVAGEQPRSSRPDSPDWPGDEFRGKTGPYAAYSRPEDPVRMQLFQDVGRADFHERLRPIDDEAVIATGEELHRLCARRGILHLLYAGFHTPGCMTNRSYGIPQMLARGYTCILLRDCTNGMETHETFADKTCLRGAIAFLEQTGVYTMASDELIAALKQATG